MKLSTDIIRTKHISPWEMHVGHTKGSEKDVVVDSVLVHTLFSRLLRYSGVFFFPCFCQSLSFPDRGSLSETALLLHFTVTGEIAQLKEKKNVSIMMGEKEQNWQVYKPIRPFYIHLLKIINLVKDSCSERTTNAQQ